jgi:hypothetical protein
MPVAGTQGSFALDAITWVLLIAFYAAVLYALIGVLLLPVWGIGAALGARRLERAGRGWWSLPRRMLDRARAAVDRFTAARDPDPHVRPAEPAEADGEPAEQNWARTLGLILLWGLAIVGGLLLITTGEQHVVQPLAGGRTVAAVTVLAVTATAATAGWAWVLFSRYPSRARPPSASFAVAAAIMLGFFSYSMVTERRSADRLVNDYCSYGAVSVAQLAGCKSHVTANQVRDRDTPASHFAQRDSDECAEGSGPFCDDVVYRRGLEDQAPPPGQ